MITKVAKVYEERLLLSGAMTDLIGIVATAMLSEVLAVLQAYFAWLLMRNRAKKLLFGYISEYKNLFLTELEQNPAILEKIVVPAVDIALKKLGQGVKEGSGDLRIGGFKIPGWLAQIIANRFIPSGNQVSEANPFAGG